MNDALDFSKIFEDYRRTDVYGSVQSEIEAVQAGRKPISEWVVWSDAPQTPQYQEVVALSLRMGLTIVHSHSEMSEGLIRVYITKPEHVWRAHALALLSNSMSLAWTFEAVEMQSRLLGYSEQQILSHVNELRWNRVGFSGTTVLLLMTSDQADLVRRCRRCFSEAILDRGLILFYYVGHKCLRRDASTVVDDKVIGRAEFRMDYLDEMFGSEGEHGEHGTVVSRLFKETDLSLLNSALTSDIGILVGDRWDHGEHGLKS